MNIYNYFPDAWQRTLLSDDRNGVKIVEKYCKSSHITGYYKRIILKMDIKTFVINVVVLDLNWFGEIDFRNENTEKSKEKFASQDIWNEFYGGNYKETLLNYYTYDFERANKSGVEYVVFHISNVSIEECYTYCFEHTDIEIIDKAIEILNILLRKITNLNYL